MRIPIAVRCRLPSRLHACAAAAACCAALSANATVWTPGTSKSGTQTSLVEMTGGPFYVQSGGLTFAAGANWTNATSSFSGRIQLSIGNSLVNGAASIWTATGRGTMVYGITGGPTSVINQGQMVFNGNGLSTNLTAIEIDTASFTNTATGQIVVNSGSVQIGHLSSWQGAAVTNQLDGSIQINGGELVLGGKLGLGPSLSIENKGRLTFAGNGTLDLPTISGGGELKLISGRPPSSAISSYGPITINTGALNTAKLISVGNGATVNLSGALTAGGIELPYSYFTDSGNDSSSTTLILKGQTSSVGSILIDAGRLSLVNHAMTVTGDARSGTNASLAYYAGGILVDAASSIAFSGGSASARQLVSLNRLELNGSATLAGWQQLDGSKVVVNAGATATLKGDLLFTGQNTLTGVGAYDASAATLRIASGADLTLATASAIQASQVVNEGLVRLNASGSYGGKWNNLGTVRVGNDATVSFANLANVNAGVLKTGSWELDGGNLSFAGLTGSEATIRAVGGVNTLDLPVNLASGLVESSKYAWLVLSNPNFINQGTVRVDGGSLAITGVNARNSGVIEARGPAPWGVTELSIFGAGFISNGQLDGGTYRAIEGAHIVSDDFAFNNAKIELRDGGRIVDTSYPRLDISEFLYENRSEINVSNTPNSAFGSSSWIRNDFAPFTNSGSLTLSNAALEFNGQIGDYTNTFTNTQTGVVQVTGGPGAKFWNLDNANKIQVQDANFDVRGTLTLSGGEVLLRGTPLAPDAPVLARPLATIASIQPLGGVLHLDNVDAKLGGGLVANDGNDGNARILQAGTRLILRNDATLTLNDIHTAAGPTPYIIANAGDVELHDSSRLLGFDGTNALAYLQRNEAGARLSLQDGASLTLGDFTNAGALHIGAGSSLTVSNLTQTGGLLTVNGTLDNTGGSLQVLGGTLKGSGLINGDVFIAGGPGNCGDAGVACFQPGNSPGHMDIAGALNLGAGAVLELQVERGTDGLLHWDSVTADSMYFDAGSYIHILIGAGAAGATAEHFDFLSCLGYNCSVGNAQIEVTGGAGTYAVGAYGGLSFTLAAAVPEPGSWVLMVSGLAALAWLPRRRRRALQG